jgi:hypothetical protein
MVRGLDAAARPFAETGLGGSDRLRMVTTEIHEQSLLLAGDVWSGHFGPRLRRGNHLARTRRGPQTRAETLVAGEADLRPGHLEYSQQDQRWSPFEASLS